MEKGIDINIDDFMSLFIAVGYLQEQRYFNIENVKHYLSSALNLDNDTLNLVDLSIEKMIEAKMVSRVQGFNNVLKISKKIPFKEIIYEKYEYLEEMINFFYEYQNYCFSLDNEKDNNIIKK